MYKEDIMKKQFLTSGDINCDCGKSWHYETLGDRLSCHFCGKSHKADGEKVEYIPEQPEEAEDGESLD